MPDDIVYKGGFKVARVPSEDHRRMTEGKGAVVVSQDGRGGGVSKPTLRFRGFETVPGAGLIITDSLTRETPAEEKPEQPLTELAGRVMFPGLPAVPQPVREQAPPTETIEVPAFKETNQGTDRTISVRQSPHLLRPQASKVITFVGEFQDLDVKVFTATYSESCALIQVASELAQSIKFPDRPFLLRIDNVTRKVTYVPSMDLRLSEFGLIVRTFLEEEAFQE